MQPNYAIAMLAAAMATHPATAAFTPSCSWWMLSGRVNLTGYCVDDPAGIINNRHWAVSTLDLNRCIGVDATANAMVWRAE